ncbi:Armadillo-like helical [Cynara cardunculus var. scolymus]|uniref:Armadillo-like helical n=1 Tax=Cynara cardunculus var. scolymus TaxID=59895 RepID=A0A103XIG6_CYNCS|nr:Armadillo-like helical [Cynara cardunculus var. scolymus]
MAFSRGLAAQLRFYLCKRRPVNVRSRQYSSSYHERDERAMEEEAENKIGWLFKLIFIGTATIGGYHIFPYLGINLFLKSMTHYFFLSSLCQQTYYIGVEGDNLIHQSVSLLNVKDPLFKRMGASRLARFATDDERRMKIVEMGGAQQLVDMLGAATDDKTRKEALNAIIAIARSDEAVGALQSAGAISVIMATPQCTEDAEIEKFKRKLLKRLQDMKQEENSS